jgi:hypothetical protein
LKGAFLHGSPAFGQKAQEIDTFFPKSRRMQPTGKSGG